MRRFAERKFNKSVFGALLLLGILFYFLPGEWIKLEKDSTAYLTEYWREGVMPFYPFFLSIFKYMIGEKFFLSGVVTAQSMLAVACTMFFVYTLQKQFQLTGWECILLYLVSMLPFSIYLPECGITHQIMTEGIAYSLFYLYFTFFLEGVWSLKIHWYLFSVLGAALLCLTRSQMIFLQIMEVLLLGWIVYKKVRYSRLKKFVCVLAALVAGVFIALLSYKATYGIVAWNMQIRDMIARSNTDEVMESEIPDQSEQGQENSEKEILQETAETEIVQAASGTDIMHETTSQFISLILSKGFFEADPEDENLFEDEMMKEIFRKTYKRLDEGGHLYKYAKQGLYMWEDLVYDKVGIEVALSIMEYDEQYPGLRSKGVSEICQELGTKTLLKHFDRYLYHTIRLMMPSFIAAVFFQIRPIYLLCHFIAMFIYLFALFEMFYALRRHVDKHKIEFMAAIFIFVVVMVVVINVVFMGIQRYMVYGMGIFYCALYLLVKETILLPFCGWLKRDGRK